MSGEISCPQCGYLVQGLNRYCLQCGVDLAIAAAFAEQVLKDPDEIAIGKPLAPEILVPRIGDYFVEMGLLTIEQLQSALDYQERCAEEGKSLLIGQALLELNLVDREILDQVITMQILKLQSALQQSNQQLYTRVQERTQELQEALERLSELNQLKSNFLATISHELRSPLTHIKGYLDILVEGDLGPLTKSQQDALAVLKRAEERLELMIEDLLQFSLASRGELTLFQHPTELKNIIQEALGSSMNKAKNHEIQLTVDLSPNLPLVWADKEKITWVILHFLDNAIKFTPQGGHVNIQAEVNGRNTYISVMDTGIGIPAERLTEIFEPFHQLDNTSARRYPGAGLGLAIARRIIEAHSSQIKVKSEPEKGSCFEFSLPLYFEDMNGEY